MRQPWDEYFLRLAYLVATRATCDRKHVGSVIVDPRHRVVSTGYNGAPSGRPSCDDVGHEIVDGHCVRTLHAESNAIDVAGRLVAGCTLYCTVTPCYDCAKRIVNSGIERVVWDEHYEGRYGMSGGIPAFFQASGIRVLQYESDALLAFRRILDSMA